MQMTHITLYVDLSAISNNKRLTKALSTKSHMMSRVIKQCRFREKRSENTKSVPSLKES